MIGRFRTVTNCLMPVLVNRKKTAAVVASGPNWRRHEPAFNTVRLFLQTATTQRAAFAQLVSLDSQWTGRYTGVQWSTNWLLDAIAYNSAEQCQDFHRTLFNLAAMKGYTVVLPGAADPDATDKVTPKAASDAKHAVAVEIQERRITHRELDRAAFDAVAAIDPVGDSAGLIAIIQDVRLTHTHTLTCRKYTTGGGSR